MAGLRQRFTSKFTIDTKLVAGARGVLDSLDGVGWPRRLRGVCGHQTTKYFNTVIGCLVFPKIIRWAMYRLNDRTSVVSRSAHVVLLLEPHHPGSVAKRQFRAVLNLRTLRKCVIAEKATRQLVDQGSPGSRLPHVGTHDPQSISYAINGSAICVESLEVGIDPQCPGEGV